MRYVRVVNADRSALVATRVAIADRWWARLRGLLGRPALRPAEGLLLEPARAIHTVGMGFPIDAAFLDANGTVIGVHPALTPGRFTPRYPKARACLELAAGALALSATTVGDRLELEPIPAQREREGP